MSKGWEEKKGSCLHLCLLDPLKLSKTREERKREDLRQTKGERSKAPGTSWERSWAHPGESFSQPGGIPLESFSSFKKLSPLSPKTWKTSPGKSIRKTLGTY